LNRVTSIIQFGLGVADKRVDYQYNAASQMKKMSRYNDLTGNDLIAESNYQYDTAGRLINLVHDSGTSILADYHWLYDSSNRITQFTTSDGVSDYTYDKTDQLVGAEHSYQASESYSYDENGNRTNSGYVTGLNNRLLSDGIYNYEYDAEGNRVKRVSIATGEVTEYEWDYRNRLIGVVTKNSSGNVVKNVEYTYDVFDRRIAKVVDVDGVGNAPSTQEHFVYDGDNIALVFDGEGNQTERFFYGTGVDEIIASEKVSGAVNWALADNLGSVRVVLDESGHVVNEISYDSFGRITNETNSNIDFRFGYVGKELDNETGLRRNGVRYVYEDRFINEDPIGFSGGDTNLYRYVGNSPVVFIDPTGLLIPSPAPTTTPIPTPKPIPGGKYPLWIEIFRQILDAGETAKDALDQIDPSLLDNSDTSPAPQPDEPPNPDPNDCEEDDECEKYRDFAHGSSLESINNIVTNGFSIEASRANTRGGRVNIPGFYTFELTQQDGKTPTQKIQLAYEFGFRHSPRPAVLIMQLCDDIYHELAAAGQVITRPVAGEEDFTETIFRPGSFGTLNREARFIDVLQF
jgi:RHS repeat-associated protein